MKDTDRGSDRSSQVRPMDHQMVEQRGVIDLYLMGKLSPEEAESFEAHYFECPECFERLELTETLQAGLKQTAAEEATAVAQRVGLLVWLRRRIPAPVWGMALLAILILPSGWLMQERSRLERELERGLLPQANTPILELSPERGGAPDPAGPAQRLRLNDESGWVVISFELETVEHERYAATLLDELGQEIWRRNDLLPNSVDALVLTVHSSSLAAADYRLRVEGVGSAGELLPAASFSFRVLR